MRNDRLHPYPAAVLATVRRRRLLSPGDRVLVALSAGPDSTALVAALAALRDGGEIASVSALHVDHGLRPGGDEDARCAAEVCSQVRVPLESVKVRVGPGNIQAAARRARYEALAAAAERCGATRIATGHTRTDQAETVLQRLIRGAGARGLAGIPPRRGRIVRPLIDRSREEGIAWLRKLGLRWRDDPTNATPRYARNRVRLTIWPAVLAVEPAAERALARAADLAREDERALAARGRDIAGDLAFVEARSVSAAPAAVRRRVVRRLWRNAGGSGAALESKHVEAVLALMRRQGPGRAALPGGLEARVLYGRLSIGPPPLQVPGVRHPIEVPGPGRYEIPDRAVEVEISARDGTRVPWPVALRTRRAGDRFRPEGGRGSKKLKSWLIDHKVPREARDGLLVIASGTRVLAIPELGAVAKDLGPSGAGLVVQLRPRP